MCLSSASLSIPSDDLEESGSQILFIEEEREKVTAWAFWFLKEFGVVMH